MVLRRSELFAVMARSRVVEHLASQSGVPRDGFAFDRLVRALARTSQRRHFLPVLTALPLPALHGGIEGPAAEARPRHRRTGKARRGGGVYSQDGGLTTLTRTGVRDNNATGDATTGGGSGIYNHGNTVTLADGGIVCDNDPIGDQCHGVTVTGDATCSETCPGP